MRKCDIEREEKPQLLNLELVNWRSWGKSIITDFRDMIWSCKQGYPLWPSWVVLYTCGSMSVIEKICDSTTANIIQVREDKIFTAVTHHYGFPGNIITMLDEHIWNDTDTFSFSWCRGSTVLLLKLFSDLYFFAIFMDLQRFQMK